MSWWVRSVTKNEKRGLPLYSLLQISPNKLNKGPIRRSLFQFQTSLQLIIKKSYKSGKSRGRTKNFATSKIELFLLKS